MKCLNNLLRKINNRNIIFLNTSKSFSSPIKNFTFDIKYFIDNIFDKIRQEITINPIRYVCWNLLNLIDFNYARFKGGFYEKKN